MYQVTSNGGIFCCARVVNISNLYEVKSFQKNGHKEIYFTLIIRMKFCEVKFVMMKETKSDTCPIIKNYKSNGISFNVVSNHHTLEVKKVSQKISSYSV